MSLNNHSVYPNLHKVTNPKGLNAFFSPTLDEITFAQEHSRQKIPRLGLLVLIKVVDYLRYFPPIKDIPYKIISHIALSAGIEGVTKRSLLVYEQSGTRKRQGKLILQYLRLKKFDRSAKVDTYSQCLKFAATKTHLTDITNAAIEYLITEQFELPALATLEKIARQARTHVSATLYQDLNQQCSNSLLQKVDDLIAEDSTHMSWSYLKSMPKTITIPHAELYLNYAQWLLEWKHLPDIHHLPDAQIKHMRQEALSLTVNHVRELKRNKQVALALILLATQQRIARDKLTQLFVRIIQNITQRSKWQLEAHYSKHQPNTDAMIRRFHELLLRCRDVGKVNPIPQNTSQIEAYFGNDLAKWIDACQTHLNYADHNAVPFMIKSYQSRRRVLMRCLSLLSLDTRNRALRPLLSAVEKIRRLFHDNPKTPVINLSEGWNTFMKTLPARWLQLLELSGDQETVPTRHLEISILVQLQEKIIAGEVFVIGAEVYGDDRAKLVDDQTFQSEIQAYMRHIDLPSDPDDLVQKLSNGLSHWVNLVDYQYPESDAFTLNHQGLVLRKPSTKKPPKSAEKLKSLIAKRMHRINILDLIVDVDQWLNIHRYFFPASGHAPKIKDNKKRFAATLLCYGCNFGPNQTAASLKKFSRKQVSWLNLRHVTEDKLQRAIRKIINTYDKMALPKQWGSGKQASADGTHWETYEQNLIAEFHFRYRLKGAIGYYVVSDKYIALFSHFISCGVYEAVHILDGVMSNDSDIRPDTLHGDTHAQSNVVFGLAYLLGIKLMPRIRNIKHLNFYHPEQKKKCHHINKLFRGNTRWHIIKEGLPEMMKIALSIHKGLVTPSSILRMLSQKNQKNALYQAFRELGRVVRTEYLLQYINDVQLRQMVNAQTNKSESYNDFIKWIFFFNNGVIAENLQYAQEKIIKYSHLLSNMAILYNTNEMTRILEELKAQGHTIRSEDLAYLSPYRKEHINRAGYFYLDIDRKAPPMHFGQFLSEDNESE